MCYMYGKATYIKLNQLRYDSFSKKNIKVPITFNGVFFLLDLVCELLT